MITVKIFYYVTYFQRGIKKLEPVILPVNLIVLYSFLHRKQSYFENFLAHLLYAIIYIPLNKYKRAALAHFATALKPLVTLGPDKNHIHSLANIVSPAGKTGKTRKERRRGGGHDKAR